MPPRRFLAPKLPSQGGIVVLGEATARHARVLRLQPGSPVELFDGRGRRARGTIVALDASRVLCEVGAAYAEPRPSLPRLTLVQALPRGEALERLVRMSTEAGVDAIRFVHSNRSVVRWDERRAQRKLQRLERIAREAARQSGRDEVPELLPPTPLADVVRSTPAEHLRYWFHPGAPRSLWAEPPDAQRPCWVAVGPEGGWSPEEMACFEQAGWRAVRLGDTVLRTDTAAAVVTAVVRLWQRYGEP